MMRSESQASREEATSNQPDDPSPAQTIRIDDYRALQQELATVRKQLNSSIEDLEAVNEELRESNEEALSANEELQSSNEELEISRQELQSLNEDLTTLNHQLETKLVELQQTTDDLDNLLTSSSVPTLFLDLNFRVRLFTPSCRSLFHLIESDTGRPLRDIAKRFEDRTLLQDAADVRRDLRPRQKRVRVSNHRSYLRVVRPYRSEEDRVQGVVITFADVTELHELTEQLSYREKQQKALAQLGQRALIENDLQRFFDIAAESVQQTMDVDFAAVWELQPGGKELLLKRDLAGRRTRSGRRPSHRMIGRRPGIRSASISRFWWRISRQKRVFDLRPCCESRV